MLRRSYRWTFVIEDITNPLLRLYFLTRFNLLVDCAARKITGKITSQNMNFVKVLQTKTSKIKINNLETMPEQAQEILKKFPDLVAPKEAQRKSRKQDCFITLNPTILNPLSVNIVNYRHQNLKQRRKKTGIIRPSKSPWSSPLHMVPKKRTGE